MSAEHRGWGKGFPFNRFKDMTSVEAGGIKVSVHHQISGLVEYLLNETVRRGYTLHAGQCWGYANRPIRGSSEPSNHSWGLAVDLNAPENPMDDKLHTDMPPWMPALWKAWGFKWGGSYEDRKDPMHFEFTGSPADARKFIAKLAAVEKPAVPIKMEVLPRMNPPIEISGKVVDVLKAPGGGVWMLTDIGAVYAWECKDRGAPNRHPEYWVDRKAARLEALGDGYAVISSENQRYEYP